MTLYTTFAAKGRNPLGELVGN